MHPTDYLSSPVIIGLRGVAGAGKSTIQSLLCQRLHRVTPGSMAGPLKRGLATMGVNKVDTPALYRELAQTLGARLRREDDAWWVGLNMVEWNHLLREGWSVVVDDVRYENERAVCDYVFFVEPGFPAGLKGEQAAHESERLNLRGAGTDVLIPNPYGSPETAAGHILQYLLDNPLLRSKHL